MSTEMPSMALVAADSLDSYIQAVNRYPMLTAEQEKELAERLHFDGDIDAAKALVMSHLRFVVHIARGYSGYGLPMANLIQEGNIGLMKAVKRFNPEVGVRLVSFAVHWIKQILMSLFYEIGVSLKLQPPKPNVNSSSIFASRKSV